MLKSLPLKDLTGWILLAAAIGLGLLSFLLIRGYLTSQEERIKQELYGQREEPVRIIVASKDLAAGDVVKDSNMSLGRMPRAHVSPRMVLPGEFAGVKHKVLSKPVAAGEPILVDFLAGVVAERFSDLLAPGERAISLEARTLDNVSGMLLPGDYIDLFVILKNSSQGRARMVPVLDRVKVLAAGVQPLRNSEQSFQPLSERDIQDYRQLTVGVKLAAAERLILAKEAGKIVYLLRNSQDLQASALSGSDFLSESPGRGYQYVSAGENQWRPFNELDSQALQEGLDPFPTDADGSGNDEIIGGAGRGEALNTPNGNRAVSENVAGLVNE